LSSFLEGRRDDQEDSEEEEEEDNNNDDNNDNDDDEKVKMKDEQQQNLEDITQPNSDNNEDKEDNNDDVYDGLHGRWKQVAAEEEQAKQPPHQQPSPSPSPRQQQSSSSSPSSSSSSSSHTIDLAILRKLASQGIPDEGSWRAIVWRLLLGYLPLEPHTWKDTVPSQRKLYRHLVDQYLYKTVDGMGTGATTTTTTMTTLQEHGSFLEEPQSSQPPTASYSSSSSSSQQHPSQILHSTLDSGRELRGQLSKTLHRDRKLRKNYNKIHQLDDSNDHLGDWSDQENGTDEDDDDDDDDDDNDDAASMVSEWTMDNHTSTTSSTTPNKAAHFLRSSAARRRSSSQMTATQRIYQQLAPKYREEWKQAGIMLNKSESPAALGLNQLIVPKELLSPSSSSLSSSSSSSDGNQQDQQRNQLQEDQDDDDTVTPIHLTAEHHQQQHQQQQDCHPEIVQRNDQLFAQFLQDAKTLEEIRKDVVRTHPDLRFYLEPQDNLGIRRYAALERILFVWAKLNKGVSVSN
jgi:hypothetical protein